MLVDDGAQPPRGVGDDGVEVAATQLAAAVVADEGSVEPAAGGEHVGGGRSLGAQPAEVGGVIGAPDGLGEFAGVVEPHLHAASHAAVGAQ